MDDWNPNLYLKFKKERTQPVKDLISRIQLEQPHRILDIGCGPGNSTRKLQKRWPNATIVGVDSSANMIEKASKESPNIQWIHGDANRDLSHLGTYDLVFSNAAIQWMPNHDILIPKLFSLVNRLGVLAIQIPNVSKMPMQIALEETASSKKWEHINIEEDVFTLHEADYYYDLLNKLSHDIYIWETHYYHVMESHQQIINWYRSTGMKPYLDRLSNVAEKEDFAEDVLHKIEKAYKEQKDGQVLFPFKRLFFIASKDE